MKKVIIVGCGFAGAAALSRLARSGLGLDICVIDKKRTFDFLPMLPDCIGRGIKPADLSYEIERLKKRQGVNFINGEVVSLDLDKKSVATASGSIDYDYLIIASGSQTNFYGNGQFEKNAFALDSSAEAAKLSGAVKAGDHRVFVISGGGYTGIELATNLKVYLNKIKREAKVVIVERAPSILGPLPEWMKSYVAKNLQDLNIEVMTNISVGSAEAGRIALSDGKVFDGAMLIWAAGVKTAGFIQALQVEKNPQGRIKVDDFLKVNDSCFAAGDAAFFGWGGAFLRMAVQFSITEGDLAAANIIRSIKGGSLVKFKPVDLGYVIPMANNRSCGKIMGINMRGFMPTMLHYFMCIYRCYGSSNKSGIVRSLLTGGNHG